MFLNGLYEFLGVNVLGFHRTISEMCVRLTWEGEGGGRTRTSSGISGMKVLVHFVRDSVFVDHVFSFILSRRIYYAKQSKR